MRDIHLKLGYLINNGSNLEQEFKSVLETSRMSNKQKKSIWHDISKVFFDNRDYKEKNKVLEKFYNFNDTS